MTLQSRLSNLPELNNSSAAVCLPTVELLLSLRRLLVLQKAHTPLKCFQVRTYALTVASDPLARDEQPPSIAACALCRQDKVS
jgi:hypothetical protein